MSITGSSSIRRLEECPVVMGLHELVPVGGRATSGRHRRRFEWFVEVCENLPDRPRLCDERDQPDVAAAPRALERKLLPYPRHELGPRNPRRVVRAGLSMRVTTASCGATVVRMSAGRGVLPLADIPDCQRRDGPPELVVGCKHPVVAMPVLPRRRHEARLVTATGRARLARDSAPSPFCRASDRRSIITCIFEPRATDGVFVPTGDGPPAFLPARPITQADLAALTEKVRRRVVCWFRMQRRPRRQGDLSGDG